jgi:hypothetical protein
MEIIDNSYIVYYVAYNTFKYKRSRLLLTSGITAISLLLLTAITAASVSSNSLIPVATASSNSLSSSESSNEGIPDFESSYEGVSKFKNQLKQGIVKYGNERLPPPPIDPTDEAIQCTDKYCICSGKADCDTLRTGTLCKTDDFKMAHGVGICPR